MKKRENWKKYRGQFAVLLCILAVLGYFTGFLTLVNRIIWQKPHNCGFFYVKFIKF